MAQNKVIETQGKIQVETKKKMKDGTYKYYLTESEEGSNSFMARPWYIRSSDVDIVVSTARNVSQIKAIQIEQTRQAIQLFMELYQLTIPTADGLPPALSREELPPLKDLIADYLKLLGKDPSTMLSSKDDQEEAEEQEVVNQLTMDRPGISDMSALQTSPEMNAVSPR